MRPVLLLFALPLGCGLPVNNPDDFRARLQKGCNSEESCDRLVSDASQRLPGCVAADYTIGKVTCKDAQADKEAALHARVEWQTAAAAERQASQKAAEDLRQQEREASLAKFNADLQATREAEQRQRDAANEKYRAEQAAEQAAHEKRVSNAKANSATAEYAVPILSQHICQAEERIAEARAVLEEESRIAKLTGTTNVRRKHDAGQAIVEAQDEVAFYKQRLTDAYRARPLDCDAAAQFFTCTECPAADAWTYGQEVATGTEAPPTPANGH